MFKNIKELFRLRKVIEEKNVELNNLNNNILELNKEKENRIRNLDNEVNAEVEKLRLEKQDEVFKFSEKIENIKLEISKEAEKIERVENLNNEVEKLEKKLSRENKKLNKIKPLYNSIQYIIEKYKDQDIFKENIEDLILKEKFHDDEIEFNPTIKLKLHCMDVKELRKAFNENEKCINEVLKKYEGRYNTKANATIYKLMVIALKAEQQNILYNLKYGKLEKAVEDVKITTQKYLDIAAEGNQSIFNTMVKFVNEIEFLFIRAVEIEYEYYIKKEQQKEEQARLREQMRQEAEDRKVLEQQKKQIEKEEEKYKTEMSKVEEALARAEDNEVLEKLKMKLEELQNQLDNVEHKKEDIVKRQNGKAGYVYIISNLGSFGDKTFKIGMTRRLNPQDRVDELGDASVPFVFDVHSFIFSDDAVGLEQKLHNILNDKRTNKINFRKEFFNVSIDELEELVQEIEPTAEFNRTMVAEQYRQTISINEESQVLV
ncbi:GIY-YIG nuclease family protein [uncultured Clostridium sp.]|uniref:GIY-YIG nuclease family protein n=1 Tax=uncultured Clostridium sp. TaxID=59620 RepID=UPI000821F7C6|nr:GIY-YIG nuclease family protein [uncultured Clostridium sp.]SCJ52705.1 T5orf172 domain [uncultured Clostridium sp.]